LGDGIGEPLPFGFTTLDDDSAHSRVLNQQAGTTGHRSYRKPLTPTPALESIKRFKRLHFDEDIRRTTYPQDGVWRHQDIELNLTDLKSLEA
jgi:hypothetical protein